MNKNIVFLERKKPIFVKRDERNRNEEQTSNLANVKNSKKEERKKKSTDKSSNKIMIGQTKRITRNRKREEQQGLVRERMREVPIQTHRHPNSHRRSGPGGAVWEFTD